MGDEGRECLNSHPGRGWARLRVPTASHLTWEPDTILKSSSGSEHCSCRLTSGSVCNKLIVDSTHVHGLMLPRYQISPKTQWAGMPGWQQPHERRMMMHRSSIGDVSDLGTPPDPMRCLDHGHGAWILRYRATSAAMGADHELPPSFRMTKVPGPG